MIKNLGLKIQKGVKGVDNDEDYDDDDDDNDDDDYCGKKK